MLISRLGVLYSMAAANMDTEMVLPNLLKKNVNLMSLAYNAHTNLRGVEISTSWLSEDHPFTSRIRWWSRANAPGFSVFQKIRAHARMKWSWNSRWWYDRFHPRRSSAASASRHRSIRLNPALSSAGGAPGCPALAPGITPRKRCRLVSRMVRRRRSASWASKTRW